MDKRFILGRIIRFMLTLLLLAFLFILFRSLSGPSLTSTSNNALDNVVIGQTALRRLASQRVWATRLSALQLRQVNEISPFVMDSQVGCKITNAVCVVKAQSSRRGIDLVFVNDAPKQLPEGIAWYGGFIDPASGHVFDFMGRAYKNVGSNDIRPSLDIVEY